MAIQRLETIYRFLSVTCGESYTFEIEVRPGCKPEVRNIQPGQSGVCMSTMPMSQGLVQDIQDALALVNMLVNSPEVASGVVVFTGEVFQTVQLPQGTTAVGSIDFQVHLEAMESLNLYIDNIIPDDGTNGASFEIVSSTPVGDPTNPNTVGYSVVVPVHVLSDMSGEVEFNSGDTSYDVTFPSAWNTNAYRVLLSLYGPYHAYVTNKTLTGFTIMLSHTPTVLVTVGYDVFV